MTRPWDVPLALAHGACPRCTDERVVCWHNGDPCPNQPETRPEPARV